MTTETKTQKGLTISFDDGDFTSGTVSVLLDLDLRTGTPVDETAWLDGNAGGSYPGSLTGFTAQNSDGKAAGSMRLVQIAFTLADAAEQVLVLTAGASKIIGVPVTIILSPNTVGLGSIVTAIILHLHFLLGSSARLQE